MQTFSNRVIDAMGGTTAVSRLSKTALSTVHSWRKNGIPDGRLDHLKLIAEREGMIIDWETGERHDDPNTRREGDASSGSSNEVSHLSNDPAPASDGSPPPFPSLTRGTVQTAPETSRSNAETYVGVAPEGMTSGTNSSAISSTLCGVCSTSNAVVEVTA